MRTLAQELASPFFRSFVEKGIKNSSISLEIRTRESDLAEIDLANKVGDTLARFVDRQNPFFSHGYVFELLDTTKKMNEKHGRAELYKLAGELAFFYSAIFPESLRRSPMSPKDYIDIAVNSFAKFNAYLEFMFGQKDTGYELFEAYVPELVSIVRQGRNQMRESNQDLSKLAVIERSAPKVNFGKRPYDVLAQVEDLVDKPNF